MLGRAVVRAERDFYRSVFVSTGERCLPSRNCQLHLHAGNHDGVGACCFRLCAGANVRRDRVRVCSEHRPGHHPVLTALEAYFVHQLHTGDLVGVGKARALELNQAVLSSDRDDRVLSDGNVVDFLKKRRDG